MAEVEIEFDEYKIKNYTIKYKKIANSKRKFKNN